MDEDYLSRRRAAASSGISLRAVIGTTLLAFAGGATLVGWLAYDGRLSLGPDFARSAPGSLPTATTGAPAAPTPTPTAGPALVATAGGMDQRITALEQRLTRIDLQAAASEGNTARAEALLVVLAARRAIERGAPLGYLENQLKLRFGEAQGNAVEVVVAAAANPVTLDQLDAELAALTPSLVGTPPNETGWNRFTRELSGLFVIRRGDAPSADPGDRMERARLMLRSGQVEAAMTEIGRLPGAALAGDWLNQARRLAAARKALDLIETAALLEPERLKDANGSRVQQPGPGAPPASTQAL